MSFEYYEKDSGGRLSALVDRQPPMPKWEVESRRPVQCMLVTFSLTLLSGVYLYSKYCPCLPYFVKSKAPDSASLGGFYTDPNHYEAGTLKGARMLSSGGSGDTFTLVGSDDGTRFWGLTGRFTDKAAGKVAIDFSSKGGPADASVTFAAGKLTFGDGNSWTRLPSPPDGLRPTAGSNAGGLYTDPGHYKAGTFAGTRMLSSGDASGGALAVVGSNDGATFWSVPGRFGDKAGRKLVVDFSPRGGPLDLLGAYSAGKIGWMDGNAWTQVVFGQ